VVHGALVLVGACLPGWFGLWCLEAQLHLPGRLGVMFIFVGVLGASKLYLLIVIFEV